MRATLMKRHYASILALSLLAIASPWAAANAQSSSSSPIPPTAPATASPRPAPAPSVIRDRLGKLDARAQAIVMGTSTEASQTNSAAIAKQWPALRSELVGQGADRSDLIAADSAVRSLESAVAGGSDPKRAANALTAAFAPIYPSVGDRVPGRVHRLDYLHRALALDIAADNWTRANGDAISARSTWRAIRKTAADHGAQQQADSYDRALNAVEDAIGARSKTRFTSALSRADIALGRFEKALDQEEPAWRRFLHNFGV